MDNLKERVENYIISKKKLDIYNTLSISLNYWKITIKFGLFSVFFYFVFVSVLSSFFENLTGVGDMMKQFNQTLLNSIKNVNGIDLDAVVKIKESFFSPNFLTYFSLVTLGSMLTFPLLAGIINICHKYDNKNGSFSDFTNTFNTNSTKPNFSNLLEGYKGGKFLRLMLLKLIFTLITILSYFFLCIPMFVFIPMFILCSAFIIIDEQSVLDSIKYSFKVCSKNFWSILFILILSFFISQIGFLFCGIGILFTFHFSLTTVYSIYKKTVGEI